MIVGIGAAAGSLVPLKEMVSRAKAELGAAYIIVYHMLPGYEETLASILKQATEMPISIVGYEELIQANHIYILPANQETHLVGDCLKVRSRLIKEEVFQHTPIDRFFSEMARTQKENLMGIILSGNSEDGLRGMQAINQSGGYTLVQDPKSAMYPGMPLNIVKNLKVNFVGKADLLAERITKFCKNTTVEYANELIFSHTTTTTEQITLHGPEGSDNKTAIKGHLQRAKKDWDHTVDHVNEVYRSLRQTQDTLSKLREDYKVLNEQLERKKNELDRAKNDWANLQSSTALGTIYLNQHLMIRKLTPSAQMLLPRNEVRLGKSFESVARWLNYPSWMEDAVQILLNGERFEKDFLAQNGCWYQLRMNPYYQNHDVIEGVVCTLIDIHKLKSVTEDLSASENLLRSIYDASIDEIGVIDKEGIIQYLNHSFEGEVGERIGQALWEGTSKESKKLIVKKIKRALKNKKTEEYEVIKNLARGKKIYCLHRIQAMDKTENSNKQLLVYTSQDITPRKKALQKIQSLNSVLEKRVEERTKDIEIANRELKVINEELESFNYTVSHDLRTPLRAMQSFSYLLKERVKDHLDDTSEDWLNIIEKNAERMGHLVDGLLSFSRIGRSQLQHEPIDMNEIFEEQRNILQMCYPEKAINWKIHTLPLVDGDPTILSQVAYNLLSNAIIYTSNKDHPEVEIGSYSHSNCITYYVRDNGIGFDPQFAEKIFGVFERLHHDQSFPGTGVGLAIVKRAIEKHNGSVWAESEPGNGACIFFQLPHNETKA